MDAKATFCTPQSASINVVNPLEIPDWDQSLENFPGATFFHTAAWARVLHHTYGYRPTYFVLGEPNRFNAILPMMEVKSWLTGTRGISLPFTDECEPLCPNAESFNRLFSAAQTEGKKCGWKYLECRGGSAHFTDTPTSTSFYNHQLDLAADETALFSRCDSAVRRAVRKAEKSDLILSFSNSLEDATIFHQLLCLTRQRHGVPPQPFQFFAAIHRHVLAQNHGIVVIARRQNVPVAGAVFFQHGKSVIYKYGASDEAYQHLRANNLVMWHAIRHYAQKGYTTLDFGRTSLNNEGLRNFKLGWGTRERRINYFRYDRQTASFQVARDDASGWYNRIFQLLPAAASRLIGVALYRHIA